MKFPRPVIALSLAFAALAPLASAQVPQLINYQGRVAVGSVNFDGTGLFKFALVNGDGSLTYWSNDGTSTDGSEPAAAVSLPVAKGIYSVLLGSPGLANMQQVPASVFTNTDVRLRVWFNDGLNGTQLLSPDQRIAAVGYALVASTAETAQALAPGANLSAANGRFTGSVGVGTSDPFTPLTVHTASGSFGVSHTDGTHTFSTYVDSVGAQIGTVSNHPLGFYANNNSYELTLYPGGNVGIGTDATITPVEKLTVNGTVSASQFVGDGSRLTGISGFSEKFGNNTNQAVEGDGAPGTIGQIVLSAGPIANGVPCNGQLLSRTAYSDLFGVIGTQFGEGDGTTTFGVPDLRAVAPNNLTYSILTTGSVPVPITP
jgi:hypothetical protein